MMLRLLPLSVALLLFVPGCSHKSDTPVPRPVAYPRIEIYDSVFTPVPYLPLHFELSRHATITRDSSHAGSLWINALYPAYGATIHFTLTPVNPATAAAVVDNRTERMSLNSGGHPTEITQLIAPSGFSSRILVTPAGSLTPVQFISVSPQWVVSGALYLPGADSNPDSVAPIVNAVYRDLIHTAKTIR